MRLNVGGTIFETLHATLTRLPDTFFIALLSGRHTTVADASGALFIDRRAAAPRPAPVQAQGRWRLTPALP